MKRYRKHIRLKGYDYSTPNYYFVTICTKNRQEFFEPRVSRKYGHELLSSVAAGPWPAQSKINSNIVEFNLKDLENRFDVDLDFYCLMPDHLHFIVVLNQARQERAATSDSDKKPVALPWVINAFKGWCTRRFGRSVFQPNYYEHIIRSEDSLDRIRSYILQNPWIEYQDINWKLLDPSL
jgi:putative transposase